MKKIIISLFFGIFLAFSGVAFFLYNTSPVQLVYMTDANYVPYVRVSLYSAIKNKHKSTKYDVHIIAENFTQEDSTSLKKMASDDVKIIIHPTRELNLDLMHLGRFASFKIALQKLFIAEYITEDKVLYLDADTLVQEDLSKVYNTPLRGFYVAAVKDGLMYQFPEHIKEIKLKWRNFYFNSGIMLLNLSKMRADNMMSRAIAYFNSHYEVFGDQDVLNVIVADKVKSLSYRYNCNSTFFEEKSAEFLSDFYNEKVPHTSREVYENAAILHFAGHKPWTPYFTHTYLKPLWKSYEKETEQYLKSKNKTKK